MAFLYILKSERNGKYYIGSTSDINRRLRQHNSGNVTFTKNNGPFKLVFVHECSSTTRAKELEKRLKRLKRRDFIDKIVFDQELKLDS